MTPSSPPAVGVGLADFLDAKEAKRIGLVSMVVPHDQLMPTAMDFARKLARGTQPAIRWTKRALNQWLRMVQALAAYPPAILPVSVLHCRGHVPWP